METVHLAIIGASPVTSKNRGKFFLLNNDFPHALVEDEDWGDVCHRLVSQAVVEGGLVGNQSFFTPPIVVNLIKVAVKPTSHTAVLMAAYYSGPDDEAAGSSWRTLDELEHHLPKAHQQFVFLLRYFLIKRR